jgi:peptidoglycan DL-endopeptidase LytE
VKKAVSLLLASFLFVSASTAVFAADSNDGGSQPTYAKVTADYLNVREEASLNANVLTELSYGTSVQVLVTGDTWCKIKINNSTAYVAKKYLDFSSHSRSLSSRSGDMMKSRLIREAESLVGSPYRFGGTSPNGFDCSGFTSYVMGEVGVDLPRTSREQYSVGSTVSRDSLEPGDLLFFDTSGSGGINHVGIYLGNNKMAHAASRDVTVSDLDWYFNHYDYLGAKRVLE